LIMGVPRVLEMQTIWQQSSCNSLCTAGSCCATARKDYLHGELHRRWASAHHAAYSSGASRSGSEDAEDDNAGELAPPSSWTSMREIPAAAKREASAISVASSGISDISDTGHPPHRAAMTAALHMAFLKEFV